MTHFQSIKEIINTLAWAKEFLVEMFEKRKSFLYKDDLKPSLLKQLVLPTFMSVKNKWLSGKNTL